MKRKTRIEVMLAELEKVDVVAFFKLCNEFIEVKPYNDKLLQYHLKEMKEYKAHVKNALDLAIKMKRYDIAKNLLPQFKKYAETYVSDSLKLWEEDRHDAMRPLLYDCYRGFLDKISKLEALLKTK